MKKYSQKRSEMPKHPTHREMMQKITDNQIRAWNDDQRLAQSRMRKEFDREQGGRMLLAVTLLAGILILFFFLSYGRAEAHHGQTTFTDYRLNGSNNCNNCDKLGNSLRYLVQASPFDAKHSAIEYTGLVWPSLPTTTETLIKLASERLTVIMEETKQQKATPPAPDWESFWVTLALALWVIGVLLLLIGTAGVFDLNKTERL